VPPVKDRVGSTETDGAITVIPAKESHFKGKGEYLILDRPPLMDGHHLEVSGFQPIMLAIPPASPLLVSMSG